MSVPCRGRTPPDERIGFCADFFCPDKCQNDHASEFVIFLSFLWLNFPSATFSKVWASESENVTNYSDGCSFFAYSWKLPAYSGAFLLTVDNFSIFTYSWSFFAYSFSFFTYS